MPDKKPRVFSGRSNPELTDKITRYLNIEPGSVDIKTFKDGEIWVKYQENIRGRDVYIVQPTQPPAENLLELLIMVDAAKRSAAKRVTVVTPYFGYSRQDRKDQPAGFDYSQACRQFDYDSRRRQGYSNGPSRSPDTGVF